MKSNASNIRPPPDDVLVQIAEYVLKDKVASGEAMETARWCLLDRGGCGRLPGRCGWSKRDIEPLRTVAADPYTGFGDQWNRKPG